MKRPSLSTIDRVGFNMNMNKESGFSLVISLLLLMTLTIIGLSIMRSGVLSEKQASNIQEKSVSFHGAQSSNNSVIETYRYDQTILAQTLNAKDLKIKVSEVEKISERLIKKDLLLDHSLNNNNDDDRTPMDFLNDTSLKPDEITLNNEIHGNRKRVIKKSLHALNDKEKHIILKRHLHHTPSTLEVIGKDLNISKERVRQLESRAFLKLKQRILKTENKQDLI